jgi:hypothetical protein
MSVSNNSVTIQFQYKTVTSKQTNINEIIVTIDVLVKVNK